MSKEVAVERERSLDGGVSTSRRLWTYAASLALAVGGLLVAVPVASATPATSTAESQLANQWSCSGEFVYDRYGVPLGGKAYCWEPKGGAFRVRVLCETHEGDNYFKWGRQELAGRGIWSETVCYHRDVARKVDVVVRD